MEGAHALATPVCVHTGAHEALAHSSCGSSRQASPVAGSRLHAHTRQSFVSVGLVQRPVQHTLPVQQAMWLLCCDALCLSCVLRNGSRSARAEGTACVQAETADISIQLLRTSVSLTQNPGQNTADSHHELGPVGL